MFFLFLVYYLTQSDPGDATLIPSIQPRADASCNDLNSCRTIWDILWSCFSTIFLCTWVTLHPNIAMARPTSGKGRLKMALVHPLLRFVKNKLPLFLCGLIAPEYILAWAVRQYLKAGEIQRKVPGWTRAHGFFLIMGGFHLYRLPSGAISSPYPPEFELPTEFAIVEPPTPHSRDEEVAEHPLDFADLSVDALVYLAPTATEIKDKGKVDSLAKAIALVQTLWFVAQCIARGAQQLPLTRLEVVTLAYAAMNVFIYYFWWDKPKDVGCPVRVYKTSKAGRVERNKSQEWDSGTQGIWQMFNHYIAGQQDPFFRLCDHVQVPMFWSGNPGVEIARRTMIGASIVGIAFGAIHLIAWNFEFPSHTELLLWRIASITITAAPLTMTYYCLVVDLGLQHEIWAKIIGFIVLMTAPLTALLYLFARIATLVVAFATLRALPLDAFKTVDWTAFILHL